MGLYAYMHGMLMTSSHLNVKRGAEKAPYMASTGITTTESACWLPFCFILNRVR